MKKKYDQINNLVNLLVRLSETDKDFTIDTYRLRVKWKKLKDLIDEKHSTNDSSTIYKIHQ